MSATNLIQAGPKERAVGSFGERLRREREMRGISLDEIATATKISTRNLRALEEEKFKQLPGGIFNKGFVRAYAKFLGIDEDQMVAEYVAASHDTEAARDEKLQQDLSKIEFRHADDDQREISLEPKSQWGTIAIIVLIAAGVFGGYEVYQKRKAERHAQQTAAQQVQAQPVQPPPVEAATPDTTAPSPQSPATANSTTPAGTTSSGPGSIGTAQNLTAPSGTQPTAPASTTTAPPAIPTTKPASEKTSATISPKNESKPTTEARLSATPIDVKIHADQQCWVSIIADGKTIMEGNLNAASEKAVRANEKVVVKLGNPGGVEVSYNGKPLEKIANGQKVRTITFTPAGYE